MSRRLLLLLLSPALLLAASASLAAAQPSADAAQEKIAIRVKEGTTLSFDLSPDGRSIVFDLLGQLWLVPAAGGAARPITDAVRDMAEDLDPSFAPDGRHVVFRAERNGRTGLWMVDMDAGVPRQLTQLPDPLGYEGNAAWSPYGHVIVFTRLMPDFANQRWRNDLVLLDVSTGTTSDLRIEGIPGPEVNDPVWLNAGKQIAFVTRDARSGQGGRVWIVDAAGGQASPVTDEAVRALAPAFTADGRHMAWFAPDPDGRMQVWAQEIPEKDSAAATAIRLTSHADVTPTRIRWVADGSALIYSADGRLWKVAPTGGGPVEIAFTAELSFSRPARALPPARFPEPGRERHATGFMGLALSPDGRRIAILALGKLWVMPVDSSPRSIADVPLDATMPAWSPDGAEVVWSAGIPQQENLFITVLKTGATRHVTNLPGRELHPLYSPDGRHLAFVHAQDDDGVLRLVEARAVNVTEAAQTRDLGVIGLSWTSPPQWSPESDGLLISGAAEPGAPGRATFVPLTGERQELKRFPDAPLFSQWTAQRTLVYVRHDRLWRAGFDRTGILSDPEPIGDDAALYASSSRDGALLFVSEGGLRLRSPDGVTRRLGWPISYTRQPAEATLIRNVRVFSGSGGAMTPPRDILVENGRFTKIADARSLSEKGARLLDAGGRIAIPGLIDLHAHTYRPHLLPGFLYFGVTTIRDQGSSMAPLVAYADAIAAGVLAGPRVGYGGFQFYSDWSYDDEQGRGIEPEADEGHVARAVSLAETFGAQHIKTRTFRRWDINTRMIAEAHRRGIRVTGHCAHLLPLVAAGIDAKEHFGLCASRGNTHMYDDLIQLFRAARIGVVPTITYFDFAARVNERPALLDEDPELSPFMPEREAFDVMIKLDASRRQDRAESAQRAREAAVRLVRAGVTIGTGSDIWQIPTGVHMEMEQLVAAGFTPSQAIRAGTAGAALILGTAGDFGTIEVGRRADLILLDADPLVDIRNTRQIWQVMQDGRLIDRPAILKSIRSR